MPLPFGLLFGLPLGIAFAWLARHRLPWEDDIPSRERAWVPVFLFAFTVYLPFLAYFVSFYGDWSFLYLVPWQKSPSAADLLLVVIAAFSVVAGFLIGVPFAKRGRLLPMLVLFGVPLGLMLWLFSMLEGRLSVVGNYTEFHNGFGLEPIGGSRLGRAIVLLDALACVAIVWTARLMRGRPNRG